MTGAPFSLILLPTLRCNADCVYCFENKSDHVLGLDQLTILIQKVIDHMGQNGFESLAIYWQGGEVMTLPAQWFEKAYEIIEGIAQSGEKRVAHYLQSNMIAYSPKWNSVLSEMFGNSVGTSMDFPNLHRRLKTAGPQEYEKTWTRKILQAGEAGIEVGVIAIPNEETLKLGAERFYSHFVNDLGITNFQINTPFPGGPSNVVKQGYPLETEGLGRFLLDLAEIWMEHGFRRGVEIGPFDRFIDYFVNGKKDLPCIWRDNCVNRICLASIPEATFLNATAG